jgi:hypothetical protein
MARALAGAKIELGAENRYCRYFITCQYSEGVANSKMVPTGAATPTVGQRETLNL